MNSIHRYILFAGLLFFSSVHAQKIKRAVEALEEKKYDKAENLFGDLLRKDSNDIGGLIGYALTMQYDVSKPTYKLNLEKAHWFWIRSKGAYTTASLADLEELNKYFDIQEKAYISILHDNLIEEAWKYSYLYSRSISEVERFIHLFSPHYTRNKETFTKRLITLTYDSLMRLPVLTELEAFQKNYPNNDYSKKVNEKIEELRFQQALASFDPALIEKFLSDYPRHPRIKAIFVQLAEAKFQLLSKNPERSNYIEFIDRFYQSAYKDDPAISSKLQKANAALEEIDYQNLVKNESLSTLQAFLKAYPRGKYASIVFERMAKIEYDEILSSNAFYQLPAYVRKYPGRYNWTDTFSFEIILKAYNYVQTTLINEFIKGILSDEQIDGPGSEVAVKTLAKNIQAIYQPDTNCLSMAMTRMVNRMTDNQEFYKELGKSCFFEINPTVDVYHQYGTFAAPSDGAYIQNGFMEMNVNDKPLFFYYSKRNGAIRISQVSSPNTQSKLFDLIKPRYNIRIFSKPQVTSIQNNGVVATFYGWTESIETCCPSFKLQILYTFSNGNFVADRAISIDPHYGEIEDFKVDYNSYSLDDL